jgi:hypothetical protein
MIGSASEVGQRKAYVSTIFLAKLLGLYCIISALTMMTRKLTAVAAVKGKPTAEAAFGLAMILGHNIWSGVLMPRL